MPVGVDGSEEDYGWSQIVGDRDRKAAAEMRKERPDLLDLAERTRARWDLFEFVEVSVRQWWRNLKNRK